jgi:hypothetical protein
LFVISLNIFIFAFEINYSKYMTAVQLEKEVPTLMTKEEFFAKLDRAEEQVQRGEYVSFDSVEELDRYIRGQLPELCSRDGIK